jgi:hypothetical protein
MSWSVNYIGTPPKLVEALKKHSEKLSGASKEEFDAALPHMIALIEQTRGYYAAYALELSADGYEYNGNANLNFSLRQSVFLAV